ncbi:restriction endonuclease subunit S [Vibrio cholerae]|uniref:restriction endonuclease subunit S n=1 Tax=Vibrio cholerae TaxID=666 RepID=UPI002F2FB304
MVPNGWNRIALEKIAEVRSGVAKGKKGLKAPIEVPYLRVANVQDGHVDLTEVKTIEIEQDKLERYSLKYGDVLMNEGGDYDKLGRGDVWLGQIEPCLHQNHVFAVRPNQDIVDSFFLAALAASNYGKTYFLSCAKRSTNLASINSTQIKEFPVLVPPLPEQKKIAQILSTWDKAITTTEQLLANSQQQKKALMQQLLTGKKRLLDENGGRFSGEWKATAVAAFIKESRVPGSTGDTAKKITVKLYGNGVVAKDEKRSGSESTKYFRRSAGQFIYSKLDFLNGAFGIIPEELDGYESTLDLPAFDFLGNVNVEWFTYYVSREDFYSSNLGLANGGRKARRVNPNDLLRIKIPTPSLEEQQKIAAVLSTADQKITALQHKLEALKQEKKALMQQLLTGKRRVKIDNEEVA